MAKTLRVGTRGSRLALAQAELVCSALRQVRPDLDVQTRVIATEGDRVTQGPLPSWGSGVFVREIEQALLRGEVDLAVHSLKDVPAETPPGLAIVAVPERANPGDVLITREGAGFESLPSGSRVGTSSLRRAAFLRAHRPDLEFVPIRGNVDTRWRKLLDASQGYDALVLAAAGLERLELGGVPRTEISFNVLLPAPGQGALAIQAREGDGDACRVGSAIDHPPSAAAVRAERRALADLEGGCRLPVAALAVVEADGSLLLRAAVAAPDGAHTLGEEARGPIGDPERVGALVAAALLARGAASLLRGAERAEARA